MTDLAIGGQKCLEIVVNTTIISTPATKFSDYWRTNTTEKEKLTDWTE